MLQDREGTMLALLGIIGDSGEPMGTRTAAAKLDENYGTKLSESTISRLLQSMDKRGWTTPVASKGRVLTPEGRARHERFLVSTRATDNLTSAISIQTVTDLLELLHARKAVESAVAADAALHCAEEDVDALKLLCGTETDVSRTGRSYGGGGLSFHRRIAEASTNTKLKVLTGFVLAPQLDHVDEVMAIILSQREAEMSVLNHHLAILEAIESGDARAAESAMYRHFEDMIDEAESYLVGRNAEMVERLLEFVGSR